MNLVQSLLNLFKKKEAPTMEDIPEEVCPNCWGRTEYGGKFYDAVKNENVDVNSSNPNIGWIQEYVNKHLTGIQLNQQEEEVVCPTCKYSFKLAE